jgi:hypothetical protein
MTNLDRFTAACIEALYFTETGDEGQPPADAELMTEDRLNLEADCRSFWHRFGCYVEAEQGQTIEQAGHDFWFTRNGHGVGFWDGDWPTYGDLLTKGAEGYGEFDAWLSWQEVAA